MSGHYFRGIGASKGVGIGPVLVIKDDSAPVEKKQVSDVETEVERFHRALEQTKSRMQVTIEDALENFGEDKANIFRAHLMMLQDPEFIGQITTLISTEKVKATWALDQVSRIFQEQFQALEDPYFQERALDIRDITQRLMEQLTGNHSVDLKHISEPSIVVAHDLTPSQTASMDREKILGLVTEIGGPTSHTAILARTLGVPAVVGVPGIVSALKIKARSLGLQGETGELYLNPKGEVLDRLMKDQEAFRTEAKELYKLKELPAQTADGTSFRLQANIASDHDLKSVLEKGAEGVGLFRTEFLYLGRERAPSEEEQFGIYKKVLEACAPHSVTIRTLDAGGDKQISYLNTAEELNPFLGLRAIRLCFEKKALFKTQLRALARASTFGKLKIMFPMISGLEEWQKAREIFEEVKGELVEAGAEVGEDLQLGVMIEIPSAALMSDVLAPEVDFFSIGTNDLLQYTCAVDRLNSHISDLYNPYHPALFKLIKMTVDNAMAVGKTVSVCGSLARHSKLMPVLVGLGIRELSMSPSHLLPTKKILRNLNLSSLEKLSNEALGCPSAEKLEQLLNHHHDGAGPQ